MLSQSANLVTGPTKHRPELQPSPMHLKMGCLAQIVSKDASYYFFAPIINGKSAVAVNVTDRGTIRGRVELYWSEDSRLTQMSRIYHGFPRFLIRRRPAKRTSTSERRTQGRQIDGRLAPPGWPDHRHERERQQLREAPWMGKHNGTYYFSYSTGWPGQIAYGTSASPLGPFVYQGIVSGLRRTLHQPRLRGRETSRENPIFSITMASFRAGATIGDQSTSMSCTTTQTAPSHKSCRRPRVLSACLERRRGYGAVTYLEARQRGIMKR